MLVYVLIIAIQLSNIDGSLGISSGDSPFDECVTYTKLEDVSRLIYTNPDIIRKKAEACCPYFRGGFLQFNQTALGILLKVRNISRLYTSTLVPKIYPTNSMTITQKSEYRTFFCHSTANVSDMEFTTRDGLSFKDFHRKWKNVYSYQLTCGILVVFSPVKLCQSYSYFKCLVKYNETYSYIKTAAIKYGKPINLSISSSNTHGTKNVTCTYGKLTERSHLNITFQRFQNDDYRLIKQNDLINNNESFLLSPIESYYDKFNDKFRLQRTLSALRPQLYNETLSCILYDDSCGIVMRQNFSILQDLPNVNIPSKQISKNSSDGTISLWVVLIAFILVLLFLLVKKKLHGLSKYSIERMSDNVSENYSVFVDKNENENELHLITETTNTEQRNKDVFISYSSQNREWVVNTLLFELEKRNIRVCIDFRDFVIGEYIAKNISDSMHSSRKTIVVLSLDYLKSKFCKEELQTAWHSNFVIPVSIEDCKIPYYLKKQFSKNKILKWEDNERFWENLILAICS